VREGEPAAAQLMMPSLAEWGREVLLTADPLQKISKTHAAFAAFVAGELPVGTPPLLHDTRPCAPRSSSRTLVPPYTSAQHYVGAASCPLNSAFLELAPSPTHLTCLEAGRRGGGGAA
jgi:hypothetical protein